MQIEISLAGVKLLYIFKEVGSIARQDRQGYALSSAGPAVQKASNELNVPHTKPSSEAPMQGWKCLKFSSQCLASHHTTMAVKLFNRNLCWRRKSNLQNNAELIKRIWLFMWHSWTDRISRQFGCLTWQVSVLLNVGCRQNFRGLRLGNLSLRITKPFYPLEIKHQSTELSAKGIQWDD